MRFRFCLWHLYLFVWCQPAFGQTQLTHTAEQRIEAAGCDLSKLKTKPKIIIAGEDHGNTRFREASILASHRNPKIIAVHEGLVRGFNRKMLSYFAKEFEEFYGPNFVGLEASYPFALSITLGDYLESTSLGEQEDDGYGSILNSLAHNPEVREAFKAVLPSLKAQASKITNPEQRKTYNSILKNFESIYSKAPPPDEWEVDDAPGNVTAELIRPIALELLLMGKRDTQKYGPLPLDFDRYLDVIYNPKKYDERIISERSTLSLDMRNQSFIQNIIKTLCDNDKRTPPAEVVIVNVGQNHVDFLFSELKRLGWDSRKIATMSKQRAKVFGELTLESLKAEPSTNPDQPIGEKISNKVWSSSFEASDAFKAFQNSLREAEKIKPPIQITIRNQGEQGFYSVQFEAPKGSEISLNALSNRLRLSFDKANETFVVVEENSKEDFVKLSWKIFRPL